MSKHHFGYLEAGDPNFCVHCGNQPGHEDHFSRGGEWEKVISDLQSRLDSLQIQFDSRTVRLSRLAKQREDALSELGTAQNAANFAIERGLEWKEERNQALLRLGKVRAIAEKSVPLFRAAHYQALKNIVEITANPPVEGQTPSLRLRNTKTGETLSLCYDKNGIMYVPTGTWECVVETEIPENGSTP